MPRFLSIDTLGYLALAICLVGVPYLVWTFVRRNRAKTSSLPIRAIKFVIKVPLFLIVFASIAFVWRFLQVPAATIDPRDLAAAPYTDFEIAGYIEDEAVVEASGLARSHRATDRMWTHNDSGGTRHLYAIGLSGERQATVEIINVPPTNDKEDWEDLSSFKLEGVPYLLIGNIGNNRGDRETRWLYAIEEPELQSGYEELQVPVAWAIQFRYEDGVHDSESMAVDADRGEILILSKRRTPDNLYSLPLPTSDQTPSDEILVAKKVGPVPNIPQPGIVEVVRHYPRGILRGMTTAMDVSDDGRRMLILTYGAVYMFERAAEEDWSGPLQQVPSRKSMPNMRGLEAMAFTPSSKAFIVARDGRAPHSPLYLYKPKP